MLNDISQLLNLKRQWLNDTLQGPKLDSAPVHSYTAFALPSRESEQRSAVGACRLALAPVYRFPTTHGGVRASGRSIRRTPIQFRAEAAGQADYVPVLVRGTRLGPRTV